MGDYIYSYAKSEMLVSSLFQSQKTIPEETTRSKDNLESNEKILINSTEENTVRHNQ